MSLIEKADTELNKVIFTMMSSGNSFWSLLALNMTRFPKPGCMTITTDITPAGLRLVYDPEMVCNLEQKQLREYIIHECAHLVFRHAWRFAESKTIVDLGTPASKAKQVPLDKAKIPVRAADVASDICVSWVIEDVLNTRTKTCVTEDDIGWSAGYRWNRDKITSEDIEQEVLTRFATVIVPQQGQGQGQGQGDQSNDQGQGQGNADGDGKGNGQGDGPVKFNGKNINNHKTPEYRNDFERKMGQKAVERAVLRAKDQAKGQGHLPGMISEELELMQAPAKIDWRAVLANYVAAAIPTVSNKTWSRLNRRFPYLLKGKKKTPTPTIGVAMDTSGSVSDEEIKTFINEIDYLRKLHKAEMTIVHCDSKIENVMRVKPKDRIPGKVYGRGGTEFIPALEFFDKEKKKPDVLVFFTDLEVCDSDIPNEPRAYKIIWVGTNEDRCEYFEDKGKYGKFIPLKIDEE